MKKKFIVYFFSGVLCVFAIFAFVIMYYNVKFPLKYKNEIIRYSSIYNLNSSFVASLINAESGFNANAVSQKGAVGLMQILPSTAEYIAKLNNEVFNQNDLFNPETNIRYGCFYLNYLKNKFSYEKEVLCAYNAGETIVSAWLKNKDLSNNGKELDDIPYLVTQNYVKKIMENKKHYVRRL